MFTDKYPSLFLPNEGYLVSFIQKNICDQTGSHIRHFDSVFETVYLVPIVNLLFSSYYI